LLGLLLLTDGQRFVTALVLFFAAAGLLLHVIGIYEVISFVTTQRTQEIGLRIALGASKLDILWLITLEGARLTLLGGVAGLLPWRIDRSNEADDSDCFGRLCALRRLG
jgi:ABC-type antimicrobial peptide transport system permease subunit